MVTVQEALGDSAKLLELAKEICGIAIAAGDVIMDVYESDDFGVETKSDDAGVESPLTKADSAAHAVIQSALEKYGVPILSEEGAQISYDTRKNWDVFWCVDPLDGTKEFIKRGGDFTVNIALVKNGVSILGVIYVPVLEKLYYAASGTGAFVSAKGKTQELPLHNSKTGKVVASKSHFTPETQEFIDSRGFSEVISVGSSLKFCVVAEGLADAYIRAGPTMEWDTAAGQAIVEAVGKKMLTLDGSAFTYNKENLCNPGFIVE